MKFAAFSCRPFGALWFVSFCNHGFTPVYTRGYNMSSRRDYCRLKAVLQTHWIESGQRLRN